MFSLLMLIGVSFAGNSNNHTSKMVSGSDILAGCNGVNCFQLANKMRNQALEDKLSPKVAEIYASGVYDGCVAAGGCPFGPNQ